MSRKIFAISYLMFFVAFTGLIPACQGKASTALGSTWEVPAYEQNYDSIIANFITQHAERAGYWALNFYGSSTTKENILDAAWGWGHSYAIAWYIGHGGYEDWWVWWPPHFERHKFIRDNEGGKVYDNDIYPETTCRFVRFAFLWSCHQGDEIGKKAYGWYRGMPFAWLHTSSLSSDGYKYPDGKGYTFNGFKGKAPYLANYLDGVDHACYYFLGIFYDRTLEYKYSIRAALDYAANAVWWDAPTFADCILYKGTGRGQMVVYGDGNLKIG